MSATLNEGRPRPRHRRHLPLSCGLGSHTRGRVICPRPCLSVVEAVPQEAPGIDPQYGCLICHADKRRAYLLGVHSDRNVRCHDCHGGDPDAFEIPEAHAVTSAGPWTSWLRSRCAPAVTLIPTRCASTVFPPTRSPSCAPAGTGSSSWSGAVRTPPPVRTATIRTPPFGRTTRAAVRTL